MKRTWILIGVFFGIALSSSATQRVSVEQLESILTESRSLPDADLAAKLADLLLTERFTYARLSHWQANLPGERSQRALYGLADRSAFLEPPAADVPVTTEPSVDEQRKIMGLAATYVSKTIPQLFVGGEWIGGTTETMSAFKEGRLQRLLREQGVHFDEEADVDPDAMLPGWLHPR